MHIIKAIRRETILISGRALHTIIAIVAALIAL